MADRTSINPGIRLDMQQLQSEAQQRWLRPAEICEILRNFQSFQISPEPPTRPPSGSLFLFDRKVLRYFRKDGHNWRKKKDGKTVKEAHEKLKVGSVDMLHCYYAHGEDNENFQRRSYWLLEEEYMHIVFVHYLEVKGNRSYNRDAETRMLSSPMSTSLASSCSNNQSESFAANAGSPSATSSLTSAFEEVESGEYGGNMLLASGLGYNSMSNQQEAEGHDAAHSGKIDVATWEEVFEQYTGNPEAGHAYQLYPSTKFSGLEGEYGKLSELIDDDFTTNFGPGGPSMADTWQKNNQSGISAFQDEASLDEASKYNSNPKQSLLGSLRASDSLQKVDSFSKWMSKELGEAGELQLESSSSIAWCNIESENAADDSTINHELHLDNYSLSPSISQDQLFSIIDISPNWCYTDSATEVTIKGRFLKRQQEKVILSCMFGEVEIPAKILKDGSGLICCAPEHSLGRVPFYVTCSNRLACSEVRDFEYRLDPESVLLHMRLDKLLSLRSPDYPDSNNDDLCEKLDMIRNITSVMEADQNPEVLEVESEDGSHPGKLLKEKLYAWLLDKVNEDGKGPNILDAEGQGVIHLAAALGYDWVIQPTLAAGVNINFRDVNGWTALHWAAFRGREKTVALLVLLGAASGALSDPSPEFPQGRTAADLASINGFKGISGFLAESLLTNHLATLQMTDQKTDQSGESSSISESIQPVAGRTATPGHESDSDAAEALSMKDSLAAVLNATQAHGRIHQVFRMRSFQRKKMIELAEDDASGITNQRIVSLMPSRMQRSEDHHVHSAAVQIQKKFRGWKNRKEFLIIRQRVVKIQAHVRGHQARKRYKPVIWSVGILEKVILRWRRKGTGLRGFRSSAQQQPQLPPESSPQALAPKEEDDDFLKEGRKQAEDRLKKALVRVKSMVQYPDARAQYRRLLTTVETMQKNQQQGTRNTDNLEGTSQDGEDAMIDVERLFDDDNFMALTFD